MIKLQKSKQAQHEILGFVLIIFLVVVIGVVFLGISLRQHTTLDTTDAEIMNFLIASSGTTTDCYQTSEPNYRNLGQLVKDCYQKNAEIICPSGENPCKALNDTYASMLQRFRPGGLPLSYYQLSFMFNGTGSTELTRVIPDLTYGSTAGCTIKRAGRNYLYIEGGTLIEEIDLCAES